MSCRVGISISILLFVAFLFSGCIGTDEGVTSNDVVPEDNELYDIALNNSELEEYPFHHDELMRIMLIDDGYLTFEGEYSAYYDMCVPGVYIPDYHNRAVMTTWANAVNTYKTSNISAVTLHDVSFGPDNLMFYSDLDYEQSGMILSRDDMGVVRVAYSTEGSYEFIPLDQVNLDIDEYALVACDHDLALRVVPDVFLDGLDLEWIQVDRNLDMFAYSAEDSPFSCSDGCNDYPTLG